jgi:hypothetical protein
MKISEIPLGTALVVKPTALYELRDGDTCLVGVRCVLAGGRYIPTSKRLSLIPDIFDDVISDELVILKRETELSNK